MAEGCPPGKQRRRLEPVVPAHLPEGAPIPLPVPEPDDEERAA